MSVERNQAPCRPIETDRLILRPWEDADAPQLYELARDPRIGHAAGWPAHTSVENSLDIIRTVLSGWEQYAVALKPTAGEASAPISEAPRLVGAIGLMDRAASDLPRSDTEYEVGYWVGAPFWGRGYMPEAVRALARHARDELDATRIWGAHYAGNDKSHRVMEKCGMTFVREERAVPVPLLGERRDQVVMALDL